MTTTMTTTLTMATKHRQMDALFRHRPTYGGLILVANKLNESSVSPLTVKQWARLALKLRRLPTRKQREDYRKELRRRRR